MKNKVKKLREQFGLSQGQLGEKVNVSRQAINA
ncbi:helix-turn-helix domain-containing protein, partial [Bacillus sp. JJ1533]